uniref:Uncharacterized protein n=1 Tax=Amphimedon queenslandica TaxID=400682 RepID=A0A1X7SWY1_AMPQE
MMLQVQIPLLAEVFFIFYIFFRDPNTILANRRPGFYLRKYGTLAEKNFDQHQLNTT